MPSGNASHGEETPYAIDQLIRDLRASALPYRNEMASIVDESKWCENTITQLESQVVVPKYPQCHNDSPYWFNKIVSQRQFIFPVHDPVPVSHLDAPLLRRFRSMLFHHPLLLKGWSLYAAKRSTSSWFQATRPLIREFLDAWEDYEKLVLATYEPIHLAAISYEMAHVFFAAFGTCLQVGTTACASALRSFCSPLHADAPFDTPSVDCSNGINALVCVFSDDSPHAVFAESRLRALWMSSTPCRVIFIVAACCDAFWHWCTCQASTFTGGVLATLNHFDVYIPTLIGPTASQVRVILVENQPARQKWPMRSPHTHTFFAHTLKVRYKSAYHPSMLRMCERVNISLVRADWKQIWEHECSRRERALAGTGDWTTIGQSFDTIGKMLGCCPAAWIQRVCYLMGTTYSPCSVFRRGPCVYILFCMELGAIYIGCVGAIQYYHRHRKRNWNTYDVGHHSRHAFDRAKEHLSKMLWALKILSRGKYKRWSMAQMYALMASIGAHRWVVVPVEIAMPTDCMRKETRCLGAIPRNVKTACPSRSSPKYLQVLKGGLAPAAHFPTEFTSMVRSEVYGKRSTLSAREFLSLVAVSEHRVGVRLWHQLFERVRARLRKECTHQKVSLFKEIPVRLPGSFRQLCGPFVDMTRSVIRQSPAPRCLIQYYMNRVMIKPRRSASVGNLLYRLRFTYTPATLQRDLNTACPCAQYPTICRPAPQPHCHTGYGP